MSMIPNSVGGGVAKRRKRFAIEYCRNGFRGPAAAIAAGFSENGARNRAYLLLQDDDVRRQIKELTGKAFDRAEMGAQETISRISRIARSDIRHVQDAAGRYLHPNDLDDEGAACIAGIEIEDDGEGGTIRKVKLRDPMPALVALAKYHRVIEEQPAPAPVIAMTKQGMIELARRTAFMLSRANAQVLEATESPQTASDSPRIDDLDAVATQG
jgi:phage terminase small subunit